ncbi:MAG: hypothetical protein DRJ47_10725 [Thermoprotei archaeon]|nr:MAG: hypothetical protein DRJ47_10725 [Thermoprotei archaeon]
MSRLTYIILAKLLGVFSILIFFMAFFFWFHVETHKNGLSVLFYPLRRYVPFTIFTAVMLIIASVILARWHKRLEE